ncbi:BMP family ABC transporter substrate-binding protein [Bacillus sp. V3-13]|uniref:BMP family lipoprotein n=1 Tax=Bacillus sp. V3-13 TaxID=2053728 RepID=UPI000C774993|nr:BMP family ABC transporter substrate-binding protein [Bacillus sp. V3-13]PLR76083.1 BMP family ABC transporter substrate-binding protein [Bacillus sp. V3-13]
MKVFFRILLVISLFVITACTPSANTEENKSGKELKIGIMLSDVGLGDQSFSDAGFMGLEKARDELGIVFDYREISETGDYETGLRELADEGNEIVIGLGFMVQEALETVAKEYPDTDFLIVDSASEVDNVYSVIFKEQEGSYLIGYLAGMKTNSNVVGFIGGVDVPLIRKFAAGFAQGAKDANPDVQIVNEYAGDFGKPGLGATIAQGMIAKGADFIYPAAGLTGMGALKEAESNGIYSFGVDSDQYFLAEKSVVTSMVKKIDNAIFSVIKTYKETGKIPEKHIELGLKEDGVGLADIRVLELTEDEQNRLAEKIEEIQSGAIKVNTDY